MRVPEKQKKPLFFGNIARQRCFCVMLKIRQCQNHGLNGRSGNIRIGQNQIKIKGNALSLSLDLIFTRTAKIAVISKIL
jgi:hypothetical protein